MERHLSPASGTGAAAVAADTAGGSRAASRRPAQRQAAVRRARGRMEISSGWVPAGAGRPADFTRMIARRTAAGDSAPEVSLARLAASDTVLFSDPAKRTP